MNNTKSYLYIMLCDEEVKDDICPINGKKCSFKTDDYKELLHNDRFIKLSKNCPKSTKKYW